MYKEILSQEVVFWMHCNLAVLCSSFFSCKAEQVTSWPNCFPQYLAFFSNLQIFCLFCWVFFLEWGCIYTLRAWRQGRTSKAFRVRRPNSSCFPPTQKTKMSFCVLHHCVEREHLDAQQRNLPLSIWNSLTKLQKHLGVWKTDCLVCVYVLKNPKWEIADERKLHSWWPLHVFLLIKNPAFNSARGAGSISTSAHFSSIVEQKECGNKL